MTYRVDVTLPLGPNGKKDPNDYQSDPGVLGRAKPTEPKTKPEKKNGASGGTTQEIVMQEGSIWDAPLDTRKLVTTEPPRMKWLVGDRIQAGRGILLTGIGGSSKTRMLYHLAIGAVLKVLPWDWSIETTGKAILVLTEDIEEDAHRTLWNMLEELSLSDEEKEEIIGNLAIYALAGTDVRLLARDEHGTLCKTPLFDALEHKARAIGNVAFIGLDPALALTEGDEGEQADQRALGKMADDLAIKTGAAVALSSHAAKASISANELQSHTSRGAGAITDAVRGEFTMRSMTAKEADEAGITDEEERKRHVQIKATKGNHLPPAAFVPIWLRRGDHGVLSQADLTFTKGKGTGEPQLLRMDIHVLEQLRIMANTHVPRLSEWRAACAAKDYLGKKDQAKEAEEQAMKRSVNRLLKAGLIERGINRGVYSPTQKAIGNASDDAD